MYDLSAVLNRAGRRIVSSRAPGPAALGKTSRGMAGSTWYCPISREAQIDQGTRDKRVAPYAAARVFVCVTTADECDFTVFQNGLF